MIFNIHEFKKLLILKSIVYKIKYRELLISKQNINKKRILSRILILTFKTNNKLYVEVREYIFFT